jgi:hypothetical protein
MFLCMCIRNLLCCLFPAPSPVLTPCVVSWVLPPCAAREGFERELERLRQVFEQDWSSLAVPECTPSADQSDADCLRRGNSRAPAESPARRLSWVYFDNWHRRAPTPPASRPGVRPQPSPPSPPLVDAVLGVPTVVLGRRRSREDPRSPDHHGGGASRVPTDSPVPRGEGVAATASYSRLFPPGSLPSPSPPNAPTVRRRSQDSGHSPGTGGAQGGFTNRRPPMYVLLLFPCIHALAFFSFLLVAFFFSSLLHFFGLFCATLVVTIFFSVLEMCSHPRSSAYHRRSISFSSESPNSRQSSLALEDVERSLFFQCVWPGHAGLNCYLCSSFPPSSVFVS